MKSLSCKAPGTGPSATVLEAWGRVVPRRVPSWFVAGFLALALLLPSPSAPAGPPAERPLSVLVLFSNEPVLPANQEVFRGLRQSLLEGAPGPVTYYIEYLDAQRFPGPDAHREFADWLSRRYRSARLDAVVAAGPEALGFLLRHRSFLWSTVPVVFGAILEGQVPELPGDTDVTGATMRWDYRATVRAALDLVPGVRRVVFVSGTSEADRRFRKMALDDMGDLDPPVEVVDWTGLDESRLQDIFQPYFTTKAGGMGLGLSICRTILELHGGSLTAENHPEGGALFCVTLPVGKEAP